MASLTAVFLIVCSVGVSMGESYFVQGQDKFPFFYYHLQRGYWPDTERTQDFDNDQGFRYRQSYQNSYQQNLQYKYPFTNYQFTLPQEVPQQVQFRNQVPQIPQQVPQVPQQVTQVPQQVTQVPQQVPQQIPQFFQQVSQPVPQDLPQDVPQDPEDVPEYQLITLGPEVPVLVKLPNQRTAILPARTVYSLPGFLEGIIQNVQNYYSVFNPLEVLKVQRNNATAQLQTDSTTEPTTGSPAPESSSSDIPDSSPLANRESSSPAIPEVSSTSAASSSSETPTEAAVETTPSATEGPEADEGTTVSSTESPNE